MIEMKSCKNQKCKKNNSCVLNWVQLYYKEYNIFMFLYQHQLTTYQSNSSIGGRKICLKHKSFNVMETYHQNNKLVLLTDGHFM
jgi:uncharacterized protein with von Willebrand factor type A (vWA) domain